MGASMATNDRPRYYAMLIRSTNSGQEWALADRETNQPLITSTATGDWNYIVHGSKDFVESAADTWNRQGAP